VASPSPPQPARPLRRASGEENIRAALYEEFGDELITKFAKVSAALEKRLNPIQRELAVQVQRPLDGYFPIAESSVRKNFRLRCFF
jgi:hypothetical protein